MPDLEPPFRSAILFNVKSIDKVEADYDQTHAEKRKGLLIQGGGEGRTGNYEVSGCQFAIGPLA